MHLSLMDFCEVLKGLDRNAADKALLVLWFHDRAQPDVAMTAGQLAKVLDDHHVGAPHSTRLGTSILRTKLARETKSGFVLKPGSRNLLRAWLPDGIDGMQPAMDHAAGFLPDAIWTGTRRGYIDAVCKQLNGCFQFCFYDAASVMLRRLIETLVIECYENLNRAVEIKDADGNYFMLKHLVDRATGKPPHPGINLGRDAKRTLEEVKALGDKSAHNRRFVAHAGDLTALQGGVRTTVQELVQIAGLK